MNDLRLVATRRWIMLPPGNIEYLTKSQCGAGDTSHQVASHGDKEILRTMQVIATAFVCLSELEGQTLWLITLHTLIPGLREIRLALT